MALSSTYDPAIAHSEPANHKWCIAPQFFVVHFDRSFGYNLSHGVGMAVGRQCGTNWQILIGSTYHRAAQPLIFFGNQQEVKHDWYRAAITLQKQWRLDKNRRCALVAEVEAGVLYMRSRDVKISGGVAGTITLPSKSALEFSPALGTGLRVRVWPRWEVLCYAKSHVVSFLERRLESDTTRRVWKPYWQLGAGLNYSF